LQRLKKVALFHGRQRDDEWLVDYAEACLTGQALRWFSRLEKETLSSWMAVRNAFLGRFDSPPDPALIPTPAAAAPRAAVQIPPSPVKPSQIPADTKEIMKILVVGDPAVGKTSLVSAFLGDAWAPTTVPTEGVGYRMRSGRSTGTSHLIHLHMWDIPGAQHYRDLVAQYISGIGFVWIIYDVTNRGSFDSVPLWHQTVSKHLPANALRLMANKCDLIGERVVTHEEGQDLANAMNVNFSELSAKTRYGIVGWVPEQDGVS